MISVVTINFNNIKGLEKTVRSVISQNQLDFEYLIIDGKSNDGSIDYLKSLSYKNIKIFINKDLGIYDAINKGIKYSTGKFVYFLNSGDTFTDILSLIHISEPTRH